LVVGRIWLGLPEICTAKLGTRPSGGFGLAFSTAQSRNLAFVLYVTCQAPGQAKADDLDIKTALRKFCVEQHIALGIFAADGDP
jgi:hypothetical protein